jgi:phospholipase C
MVLGASLLLACTSTTTGAGVDAGTTANVTQTPIEHLVIIVMENHSFDNLFANFPGAESLSHFEGPNGAFDAPRAPDRLPRDLCHSHECALTDWANGAMNGWEQVPGNDVNGDHLAWAQYQRSQIPGLWELAENYALADHFHSSMLGPSFPGHMMTLAAQAAWSLDNPTAPVVGDLLPIWGCDDPPGTTVNALQSGTCTMIKPTPCFNIPSAPDILPAGATWKFYGTSVTVFGTNLVWSLFDAISPIRNGPGWSNVVPESEFAKDVANGTLPTVSWLVPQDLNSGHPPLSMCDSVNFITRHVNEVIRSPLWSSTAIIVTWDDFGGFFDHVPPPSQYGCDAQHPYGLGFRLPAIIISPWVKRGVFHDVTEQASIVRLIQELFDPAGATGQLHARDPAARDDVAGSLLPAFDFTQTPLPAVPAQETCP